MCFFDPDIDMLLTDDECREELFQAWNFIEAQIPEIDKQKNLIMDKIIDEEGAVKFYEGKEICIIMNPIISLPLLLGYASISYFFDSPIRWGWVAAVASIIIVLSAYESMVGRKQKLKAERNIKELENVYDTLEERRKVLQDFLNKSGYYSKKVYSRVHPRPLPHD